MTKSEAVSWYRIQEMFRFQAFHMYGIIESTLSVGLLLVQWINRKEIKNSEGHKIEIPDKEMSIYRYLLGGILFGLGWAFSGACPGPIYTLI